MFRKLQKKNLKQYFEETLGEIPRRTREGNSEEFSINTLWYSWKNSRRKFWKI